VESYNERKGEVIGNQRNYCVSPVSPPSNIISFLLFSSAFHLPFQKLKSFGLSCLLTNAMNVHKRKAIPLQAWTGPEGSRSLRLPDFKTIST